MVIFRWIPDATRDVECLGPWSRHWSPLFFVHFRGWRQLCWAYMVWYTGVCQDIFAIQLEKIILVVLTFHIFHSYSCHIHVHLITFPLAACLPSTKWQIQSTTITAPSKAPPPPAISGKSSGSSLRNVGDTPNESWWTTSCETWEKPDPGRRWYLMISSISPPSTSLHQPCIRLTAACASPLPFCLDPLAGTGACKAVDRIDSLQLYRKKWPIYLTQPNPMSRHYVRWLKPPNRY